MLLSAASVQGRWLTVRGCPSCRVPQWSDLEHKLYAFFSWVPDGIPDAGMLNNNNSGGAAALHAPTATTSSSSSAPFAAVSAGLREFPTPGVCDATQRVQRLCSLSQCRKPVPQFPHHSFFVVDANVGPG